MMSISSQKSWENHIICILYEHHFPYAVDHNQGLHVRNQITRNDFFLIFICSLSVFPLLDKSLRVRLEICKLGIVNGYRFNKISAMLQDLY